MGGGERKRENRRGQKRSRRRLEVTKSMDMKQDITHKKNKSKTLMYTGGPGWD